MLFLEGRVSKLLLLSDLLGHLVDSLQDGLILREAPDLREDWLKALQVDRLDHVHELDELAFDGFLENFVMLLLLEEHDFGFDDFLDLVGDLLFVVLD